MRRALTALVTLLVGVGLFPGLGQTAMVKRSLEELSQEADSIVIGTVTMQVSSWNDQGTAIHTDITVTIEASIKGLPRAEVTFRIEGGIVGDVGMRTSNDPVFKDRDRVILFLHTASVPVRVVGQSQGAFKVHNDMVTRNGHRVPASDFIQAIRSVSP
jgi:hypothetical protein